MSDKSVPEKLQVKPGRTFKIINQPPETKGILSVLPEGSKFADKDEPVDVLLIFVRSIVDIQKLFPLNPKELKATGIYWLAYPKKTSGIKTDLTRDVIWDFLLTVGWTGISMISIDGTWSAFRMKKV